MRVRVLFFAAIRDIAGLEEELLDLPEPVRSVGDLAPFLAARYPALEARLGAIRFARNEAFAEAGDPLADGDVIAVIPPVAGG
jgi:molybdopterin converting factor subunit 1